MIWHAGYGADSRLPVMGIAHADQQEIGFSHACTFFCSAAISGVALGPPVALAGHAACRTHCMRDVYGTGLLVSRWSYANFALGAAVSKLGHYACSA